MTRPSETTRLEDPRYSGVVQSLHWITAALVIIAYVVSPGGSEARVYSAAKDFDRSLHELLGILVFIATLIRLLWRAFQPTPTIRTVPRWMERSALFVQSTLYALLIGAPLTAISGAWLQGHRLTVLGFGVVNPMLPESRELGQTLSHLHGWLGDAIIWLAGFHAAAALFHHFAMRDGVLRAMLPAIISGSQKSRRR
jgi:cytochrome b561